MNDISDKSIMAALGRQMTIAVRKQAVTAGNLANVDTPGYRTREASFDDVLDGQLPQSDRLAVTHTGHLPGSLVAGASQDVREVEGLVVRRDGNNVELDRELLRMTRASGDFAAAQTALAAKFRLIRYALTQGGS
jgi:flagellar basal-body rod protein FlgB